MLLSLLLVGCAPRQLADLSYECGFNKGIDRRSGKPFDPERADRPSPAPIVKVVRFTDQGELVDRCEVSDALYEVRGLSPTDRDAGKAPLGGALIVLYIHGWKHDGESQDSDLLRFTDFVEKLQAAEQAGLARTVVGLYLAWPGASIKIPVVENLTFWDRKRAADRVISAAYISKFISGVHNVLRQRQRSDDFFVTIGHSFGARILYTATSQILLHSMQLAHPGRRFEPYGLIHGLSDLTVLLNPAFEAATYTSLDASRRWQERFSGDQQPLLLTIATDNDWATSYAYPLGQTLAFEWDLRQQVTLGNYEDYVTHDLSEATEGSGVWFDHYCRGKLCLNRRPSAVGQPGFPFILARTNSSILNGHNGIWEEQFQTWLIGFIRAHECGAMHRACADVRQSMRPH